MLSSIAKLFDPEHYKAQTTQRPTNQEEECFSCTATSAALLLGLGTAFGSGVVFNTKDSKPLGLSTSYMRSVRIIGVLLVPLGLYRSWQAWDLYKQRQ